MFQFCCTDTMASGDLLRSDPLADPIIELGIGFFKASIVFQAIELGIFDKIEALNKRGVTVKNFANHYGYKPEVTERLLDALVCYRLLNKSTNEDGTEYSNSKTTEKYLLPTDQPNLTSNVLGYRILSQFLAKFDTIIKKGSNNNGYDSLLIGSEDGVDFTNLKLKQTIKTDQNQNPVLDKKEMNKTETSSKAFMIQMDAVMRPAVHAITVAFDVAGYKTLLDLGGNSGYLAYEFIKTYPQMKAIVLDRPDTVKIAKELQPSHTKSKVEFVEGDFFDDKKFPEADLIVLSHVIHNWDEDQLDILLTKTYQSLKPGGRLLVLEKILNDDKTGPETSVTLDVLMACLCNGRERNLLEYAKLLGRHGFQKIEGKRISGPNYFDAIIARKPRI